MPVFKAPNGIAEIKAVFGDITRYVRADGTINPTWEATFMVAQPIPFALPLSWDPSISVSKIRVHRVAAPVFAQVFAAINDRGLSSKLRSYGGAYVYRPKRGAVSQYSVHSWGVAIDLDVDTNQMGKAGDMAPEIVAVFREFGFTWGGGWSGKNVDPMHFQLCTGY